MSMAFPLWVYVGYKLFIEYSHAWKGPFHIHDHIFNFVYSTKYKKINDSKAEFDISHLDIWGRFAAFNNKTFWILRSCCVWIYALCHKFPTLRNLFHVRSNVPPSSRHLLGIKITSFLLSKNIQEHICESESVKVWKLKCKGVNVPPIIETPARNKYYILSCGQKKYSRK